MRGPNVSVRVDGNSEKISPQPKNTTPESSTNQSGSLRVTSHRVIAAASSEKAMNIVFSRPIRSETHPKNGRVSPLVMRSTVSASGSAAMPHTVILAMPKSAAKLPICEITISPEVDISDIITNISQKTGVFSIVALPIPASAAREATVVGGRFRPQERAHAA